MLKGLPASGKTTHAKEKVKRDNGWVRVNKDDIRRCIFAGQGNVAEKLVIQTEDAQIRFFMTKNKNIIVDDTNLNPHHERRLQMLIEKHNKGLTNDTEPYRLEILFFDTPLSECFVRNSNRTGENFVPVAAIQEMYDKYLKNPEADAKNEEAKKLRLERDIEYIQTLDTELEKIQTTAIQVIRKDEKVIQDESLPHIVLCDLDGTACIMGDRSPYEESKVHLDKPNYAVTDLINLLSGRKLKKFVFMSGRTNTCREASIDWIDKNTLISREDIELYMRKAGDNRKDSIVKEELYREHIQPNYYVDFVLDDRNQVVEMWRRLGLTCFQVAEGNF